MLLGFLKYEFRLSANSETAGGQPNYFFSPRQVRQQFAKTNLILVE